MIRANYIQLLLFTIVLQKQSKWNLVILIINMDFNLGQKLSPGRFRVVEGNAFSSLLGSSGMNTNKENDLSCLVI